MAILRSVVILAFLAFVHLGYATGEQLKIVERGGWIRVGLQSGVESTQVTIPSGYRILADGAANHVSRAPGAISISAGQGGVIASVDGKQVASGQAVTVEPDGALRGSHFEIPKGRYRGRLVARASGRTMRLINEVQVDDWLKGVLPAEIGSAHPEALKAQAVAARSEVLRKLERPPHAADGFDFCTGVHCQVYKGMAVEEAESNAACEATLGIAMTVGGKPLDAVYHNVCGGMTAGAEDVWDSDPVPGLRPVVDAAGRSTEMDLSSEAASARFIADASAGILCNPVNPGVAADAKKYFRWNKVVGASALEKAGGVGPVRDVRVVERRRSGRVRKLEIVGDRGRRVIEKELPIRNALDLWSGFFVVDVVRNGVYVEQARFAGAGNGHGVGMCQMGARAMAVRGYTCDQILGHYYRDAQVQRLYRR